MGRLAACTAAAGNYLAFARVLERSFHRFHPDIPFYALVAGVPDPRGLLPGAGVTALTLKDLRIPNLSRMLLHYSLKQTLVAAKPALLRHVLEAGYETALFLDPDTLVTASLDPVFKAAAAHSLTVTPHAGPGLMEKDRSDFEKTLLYMGMYNGGLIGAGNREETRRFLAWWEERLRTHCLEDPRRGLHYDQRWLDLAPGLVEDFHLLRDPGCNAAYWSLPDVELEAHPDGMRVNGVPLRLYHFSGFNPDKLEVVTRHVPGLRVDETGAAAVLYREYAALLREAGWAESSRMRWPWDGWRRRCRTLKIWSQMARQRLRLRR